MRVTKETVGELITRLYSSEINFRIETLWNGGYTWALTGYSSDEKEKDLPRIWIDDAIQGTGRWIDVIGEIEEELNTIHFQKRDWFERGSREEVEEAISELCAAACRVYPDSEFAKWYLAS
ncbi:MAG TPA: hypothetical protein VGK59_23900 [Ohtaekwangia sp.]